MKKPTRKLSSPTGSILAISVAVVLLLIGGWQVLRAFVSMPAWRGLVLTSERINARAVAHQGSDPREVRGARLLVSNSASFFRAWKGDDIASERKKSEYFSTLPGAGSVARLQLAAMSLLAAERSGADVGQSWPRLAAYLEGLDLSDLEHGLAALVKRGQRFYEELGLSSGVALQRSLDSTAAVHGPFLQYFVDRLDRVSMTLEEEGKPKESALVRRTVERLLVAWIDEEGPWDLRLLAADLLGRHLATSTDARARSVAEMVTDWRQRALEERRALPATCMLLVPAGSPPIQHCASAQAALLVSLAWVDCVAIVALSALTLSILTFWWIVGMPRPALVRALLNGVVLGVLAIIAVRLLAPSIDLELDFRRNFGASGWPRHLLLGVGVAVGALFMAVVMARFRAAQSGSRLLQLGAAGTGIALVSALFIGVGVWAWVAPALRDYQRCVVESVSRSLRDPLMSPDNAGVTAKLRDELRAWERSTRP